VSLLFYFIAILIGLVISWQFSLNLFIYGLISKAYWHPAVRLKKYPIASLLIVAVFQGAFTYLMSMQAMAGPSWFAMQSFYIQLCYQLVCSWVLIR
jgi:1,4-dihydroxy-2-naphthoate octaprenyltransferase